jgi:hypothetical protein
MNTNTNPSQSTEEQLTSHAPVENQYFSSRIADQYDTPAEAQHRTFELSLASPYEAWLLTTFTMSVGERLWVSSYRPFEPVNVKLTFRQGTLELPELNWLLERALNVSARASAGPQRPTVQRRDNPRPLRWEVLSTLAKSVDHYLRSYDVIAMVKDLAPVMDRAHFDVAAWNIPSPRDNPEAFEKHMSIFTDCLALSYVDDSYLR